MELGFFALLALVIAASVGGALVTTWKLHRRTLQLEYRMDDAEERLLTVKNREKSQKRWSKEAQTDAELEEFLVAGKVPKASKVKYANDPLGEDE